MLEQIEITSPFWQARQQTIAQQMIPYQWDIINDLKQVEIAVTNTGGDSSALDSDKSYVVENFLIAAGKKQGKRGGMVFQDSDAYKWLEAVAYTLEVQPNDDLQAKAERLIDIIAAAQDDDGYLNTYFQVNEPERKYQSLYMSHELYCAGHLIEAAVAYTLATQTTKFLDVACKLADNIDAHFGPEEGKIHGSDGHEEIELALLRLYELTQEERYLKLAEYLLLIRGQDPDFFTAQQRRDVALGRKSLIPGLEIIHPDFTAPYFQSDKPVDEQTEAKGHAVRVVYLCAALALGAKLSGNQRLLTAANNYWRNIVQKRLYLTGAIGSTAHGEAFTGDYDLPNDSIYGETCASVGLIFFAHNMLRHNQQGACADVMEQALYNTVLSGMNLDGKGFFYVNPLEANPYRSQVNPGLRHVLTRRPGWFACACCPPNLARMVMSLGHYLYHEDEGTIFSDLFVASNATFTQPNGSTIKLQQSTNYPWDGTVRYEVKQAGASGVKLALRLPQWCEHYHLTCKGQELRAELKDGYLYLKEPAQTGDLIELTLELQPMLVEADARIGADYGKQAVVRGPIVYCAEEVDNGAQLQCLHLGSEGALSGHYDPALLGGVYVIESQGKRRKCAEAAAATSPAATSPAQTIPASVIPAIASPLYRKAQPAKYEAQTITLIPYYAWCNRAEGEMRVWLNPQP